MEDMIRTLQMHPKVSAEHRSYLTLLNLTKPIFQTSVS